MFVTIGSFTQHVSDISSKIAMALPGAKIATAHEAAVCLSRLVANGDKGMHEANKDFIMTYSSPLLGSEISMPVPNKAMNGFNVRREVFEPSEQFEHLFDDEGGVLRKTSIVLY